MCDPVSAAIGGTALVGSTLYSSHQSNKAGKTQAAASDRASQVEWDMYQQNREDMALWREAGGNALNQLVKKVNSGPGDYTKSPGYDFRLEEGNKNILRQHGNYRSGASDKALIKFGQDYATNDYGNFLSRYYDSLKPLQSLAGTGQTTATQTAQMGQQTANAVGNNVLAAGNARASGYIGQANALNSMVGQGVGLAAMTYGGKGWGAGGNNNVLRMGPRGH